MRDAWKVKELNDVCHFENGDRGKNYPSKKHYISSGIPFITAANVESGHILDNLNYISKERFNLLSRGKFRKNDFLFCLRGSLGKFGYVRDNIEGGIASSMVIVRTGEDLTDRWLNYYFISDICQKEIDSRKGGAAQPNLGAKDLKKFQIPIPPFEEQKQIVVILDKAFEAIDQAKANIEKNIENAKELFQSKLNAIFSQKGEGWEEKTLGEVCEIISGQSPKSKYYNKEGIGLPFYQGKKEFGSKYLGEPTNWTIKTTKKAYPNDILISVRAPVGPVNISTKQICIGRGLAAIRINGDIIRDYLFHYLHLNENKHIINDGAVFSSITKKQISKFPIPVPPLNKQEEIVERLEKLDNITKALIDKDKKKLVNLEELKKSLLEKAFSGKLTSSILNNIDNKI